MPMRGVPPASVVALAVAILLLGGRSEGRSVARLPYFGSWGGMWPSWGSSSVAMEPAPWTEDLDKKSCLPKQVHLALTGDETEMMVSWVTEAHGCKASVSVKHLSDVDDDSGAEPPLEVGSIGYPLQLNSDFSDLSFHVPPSHTGCGLSEDEEHIILGKKSSIHIHNAVLKGLTPGAQYQYTIHGSPSSGQFTAAPKPDAKSAFSFLAFADMGEPEDHSAKSPFAGLTSKMIIQDVKTLGFDMVLHVGDLAYAHGHSDVWDKFFEQIEPVAAAIPYMISVGNYEYDYTGSGSKHDPSGVDKPFRPSWWNGQDDSGGECGLACAMRFQMPGQGGKGVLHGSFANDTSPVSKRENHVGNPPFWYHFRYASAHFILLSGEHDVSEGSTQHKWLKNLLSSSHVDRSVSPWLIVGIHRPLYVPYPHHSNRKVAKHLRKGLEPLFSKYKVDVVISGHVHSYTRSCPVYNWDCVEHSAKQNSTTPQRPAVDLEKPVDAWVMPSTCGLAEDTEYDEYVAGCDGELGDEAEEAEKLDFGDQESMTTDHHGVTHFVIGTAGHKLSRVSNHQPDWLLFNDVTPGYARFHVEGEHKLRMEFVDARSGKVKDSVEIMKR